MNLDEIIINIDFEDRAGLGYEIFEVCEKNGIDKISMEVTPDQGMAIKIPGHFHLQQRPPHLYH
ncbi:hypothetical protein [Bacillus sp. USDA818B3_A]|uniref:hypothetical protein n=1 Tax=Bacillus sp. USDA818B3_A TaxID=2698834 RepID=UPI001371FD1E|nr:hypothetical protein [Bacillus sp. USDA818B3_A]